MHRLLCLLWGVAVAPAIAQPSITLTDVPAYGVAGDLAGQVRFASPTQLRAHTYVFVPDTGWFSYPYCPGQTPDAAGNFRVNLGSTHLSLRATRIAVLAWLSSTANPCVSWAESLPVPPAGVEVTRLVVSRANPSQPRLQFSGIDWLVKDSGYPTGPGPNVFTAGNVTVDAQGRLRLAITPGGSAEIIAPWSFGYGAYRVYLDTPVNTLHPNAVFGFFTWDTDTEQSHREIDVEISRWNDPSNLSAQFVVQPYTTPGNRVRFMAPDEQQTAYEFLWLPDRLTFTAIRGHSFPATPANTVAAWSLQDLFRVPTPGNERLRLNFYRYLGAPLPAAAEIIVRKVEFLPAPAVSASRITAPPKGMSGFVKIEAPVGEAWSLDLPAWVHALPASGVGPTDVWYSILPNFRGSERSHFVLPGGALRFDQAAHPGAPDQRFAAAMYYNMLGRAGEDAEVDFQVLQGLFRGLSRAGLAYNFFHSAEFNLTARFAAGLYVGLLNRDPEYRGWLFQRNALSRGEVTQLQLVQNFLESQEYRLKFGNPADEQFVANLYAYVLRRSAQPAELAAQVAALRGGMPRAIMASAFLNSEEFRAGSGPRLMSFLLYAAILQRDGSPAERDFRASQLQSGVPLRTLLEGFIESPEFAQVLE